MTSRVSERFLLSFRTAICQIIKIPGCNAYLSLLLFSENVKWPPRKPSVLSWNLVVLGGFGNNQQQWFFYSDFITSFLLWFSWRNQQFYDKYFRIIPIFENHNYIPEVGLLIFFEPWLWILRTSLIPARGLFLFLIGSQHGYYLSFKMDTSSPKILKCIAQLRVRFLMEKTNDSFFW